ncbi:MAG TPA: DUF1501 domain-containing protein, partial [Verrucomicrobiota bacterium]|nr:DUF1501 domain-containing protein [Verrucomicrobiota bacterium]
MNDPFNRRRFLRHNTMGIGGLALAWMLKRDKLLADAPADPRVRRSFDLASRRPHHAPKARAMISLFMHGGPSHMDLTDPKPELTRLDGKEYTGDVQYSFANEASRTLLGSPWKFKKHGQCGMEFSELLPYTAAIADDLCLIRSMHTGHNGHEVSIRYMNAGIPAVLGRPSLGAWLAYALGSETDELPAYMVLSDPGGHPVDGVHNWTNGFLPSLYQGTVLRAKEPRIFNLNAPANLKGDVQRNYLGFLNQINQAHLVKRPGEHTLQARIDSYELAARMQTAATEALDISGESAATKKLYGIDQDATREYGTRCLIARRLIERGVRFVQLFLNGQPWDNHENIHNALPGVCRRTDQPAAALVTDLKQRGLLDTTVVHWGGEIGRLPVVQSRSKPGR